jgi:hypothetical protein
VWYDGTQVYNQTGNIMQDHTTGIYFKYGIYRAPGSGGALPVQVHYYANVEYGTSSLLARVSSPIPFPVPTSFVPPPQTVINLGSQENFGLGTVTINTVLAAVAAGTLVVVFAVDENASITGATVTDSSGNTYTQITSVRVSATSYLQAFYSVLTNPLTNASTLSYHCAAGSGSFNVGLNASAVIGYSTLDSATTNTATSVGTPYSVTGAGPASVPNEIYFGFALSEGASITAPGGSWTRPPPAIIGVFVNTSAYQINSGTSALTFSGAAGSFGNGAIIVSFK